MLIPLIPLTTVTLHTVRFPSSKVAVYRITPSNKQTNKPKRKTSFRYWCREVLTKRQKQETFSDAVSVTGAFGKHSKKSADNAQCQDAVVVLEKSVGSTLTSVRGRIITALCFARTFPVERACRLLPLPATSRTTMGSAPRAPTANIKSTVYAKRLDAV